MAEVFEEIWIGEIIKFSVECLGINDNKNGFIFASIDHVLFLYPTEYSEKAYNARVINIIHTVTIKIHLLSSRLNHL